MEDFLLLKNLATNEVERGYPWDFKHPGYPDISKSEWATRINDISFDWCFFSTVQGRNPSIRVSLKGDNPAQKILAIVVEYDRKFTDEQIADIEVRWNAAYKPNKIGTTKSGGVRILWLLEAPVIINGNDHFERFMKKIGGSLNFETLLPAFDKKAYSANMFWEACDVWVDIHDTPLNSNFLEFIRATTMDVQKDFVDEAEIPFDVLEEEMNRRWPGRWVGNFEAGVRGCRFWDDQTWDQGSPNPVLVTEKGCINFSSRSREGFWSWADIFGTRWVESFQHEKFGKVVREWYFDGRNYYRLIKDGTTWVPVSAATAQRHLQVDYNLDGKTKKNDSSEVAKVMTMIEKTKFVDGAVPFVNNPDKVVTFNGNTYLNTARCVCLDPAVGSFTPDDFWFIADIIDCLFRADIQIRTYCAWLQRFYVSHYLGKPEMGQVVIIAGERGGGKTLLTNKIIAGLVGGIANCKNFLMDGGTFSEELVSSPLWSLDDEDGAGDARTRAKMTAQIKKLSSSGLVKYNKKYGTVADIPWLGRLVMACNLDDQSLASLMPNVNMSVRDKLLAFRVYSGMKFPNSKEKTEQLIAEQLPMFARWLMDEDFSDICNDHRFGVDAYIHPELELAATQNSEAFGFQEVVDMFRAGMKKDEWVGTASGFWDELLQLEYDRLLGNRLNNTQIGRLLTGLIQTGYPYVSQSKAADRREFKIRKTS